MVILPYKADYIKHLTGWYNIFISDSNNNISILSNDRFGLLPLYFYESDSVFIFASKIESILVSGFMPRIEFDAVSLSEHLLFNYPVSDKTFIKNISTLQAASQYRFSDNINCSAYWSPAELISSSPLPKNQSLDLIDGAFKHALITPSAGMKARLERR